MGWRPLRDSWMQAELPSALTQAQRNHVGLGLCHDPTLLSSPLQAHTGAPFDILPLPGCMVHCSKHLDFCKRQSTTLGFGFSDTNARTFLHDLRPAALAMQATSCRLSGQAMLVLLFSSGCVLQIFALFEWLVDPCIAFVRRNCREVVTTADINLPVSLMNLFSSQLDSFRPNAADEPQVCSVPNSAAKSAVTHAYIAARPCVYAIPWCWLILPAPSPPHPFLAPVNHSSSRFSHRLLWPGSSFRRIAPSCK